MSAPRPTYQQLQPEYRLTIPRLRQQSCSTRSIARLLGRSASTISREIERNAYTHGGYGSQYAQRQCIERQRNARVLKKLCLDSIFCALIVHFLRFRWSSEQIALTLACLYPKGHELRISHESIYQCIYAQPVGGRKELIATLRHAHNKRLPRSKGKDRRGHIPYMLSIHERPPEIEERRFPGHWEGDLIKGVGNASVVGTLVERTSRLLILIKS
jgi:IS30 family transposase